MAVAASKQGISIPSSAPPTLSSIGGSSASPLPPPPQLPVSQPEINLSELDVALQRFNAALKEIGGDDAPFDPTAYLDLPGESAISVELSDLHSPAKAERLVKDLMWERLRTLLK
jgi:hypothetical protein